MSRHIAIVTPGFPRDEEDSSCVPVVQAYVEGLQKARPDWRISVFALDYPYHPRPYGWRGVQVFPASGNNLRSRRPLVFTRVFQAFRRLPPPDLIHSMWLTDATWIGQILASTQGIPQVATVMGQDAHPENRHLRWLNLRKMEVVPLSQRSADTLRQTTGFRAPTVLPIGVAERDLGGLPGAQRSIDLLSVGNLIPLKRPERFVDLVASLKPEFPNINAVIVGSGPEAARIEARIRQRNLGIRMVGELPRPEVLNLMGQSRVLVVNSLHEGMGYVVLEALGRGAHVVSTPVGIAMNSRKCTISADLRDMSEAIRQVLRNPVDAESEVPFPLAASVEGYLEIYQRCWGRRKR